MEVRLVIFEDNEKLRNSLTSLFEYSDDYFLVGSYENALRAKTVITRDRPDVVLLDIDLPGMDGISAIPVIKAVNPLISVIMYTQFEDDEKLFESLCAGADGYILKNTSPMKLFEAIGEVGKGGVPISPAIAKKILKFFHHKKEPAKRQYGLTKREGQVLDLLVKGYSIKHIASELNMAFDTSRSHLRNVYRKMHVSCGKEAIAKVLERHIRF